MTRHDNLAARLNELQEQGYISDWYAYAPGDRYGKRWVLGARGTFTTREAEVFVMGAKAVIHNLPAEVTGIAS